MINNYDIGTIDLKYIFYYIHLSDSFLFFYELRTKSNNVYKKFSFKYVAISTLQVNNLSLNIKYYFAFVCCYGLSMEICLINLQEIQILQY